AFGVLWRKNGVGVRYPGDFTPNRLDLYGAGAVSLRGYYLALFQVGVARIGGSPISAATHVGYQYNANESFYGFGEDSSVDNRISFGQSVGALGAAVWWRAPWWLYVGGGIGFRDTDIGEGSHEYPPPPDFDPGTIPGFVEEVEYLNYDAFVQVDWRNEGNPYRGGLYAARWSDWNDRDVGLYSFRELDLEVQQYFPWLMNKRVIALRARTIMTDADPGQQVPFYLMPTLGGTRDLRGYNYARFRDRNMLLLNAEYRAEVWMAMDLALFFDAGKVVADRKDLNFSGLSTDYGIGVRMKTSLSTFLRADFAFGGEGFHAAITFDNAFDTTPLFTRLLQTVR
ncbi:MAG: BamA/TamA family outer membrane protein, partial [Acidobacteriota bacterium]